MKTLFEKIMEADINPLTKAFLLMPGAIPLETMVKLEEKIKAKENENNTHNRG
jgi:hypothetical protein